MHIFYTPDVKKQIFKLNEEESKHAIRVLRLKVGDQIQLIDGKGGFYTTEIVDAHSKACEVKILEKIEQYGKRNYHIHIAIAPTKNISRFEWFLEKATEIGIDEITPLLADHSERRTIKPERLQKVITSAVKQSIKAYHPVLHPFQTLDEFFEQELPENKFIAHLEEGSRTLLSKALKPKDRIVILIGPEGDFSPSEIQQSLAKGFMPVSLGDSRLRTETAGIAAVHTTAIINQIYNDR